MSLLFNTVLRFVIAFLPRSNRCQISWLQSPSAVILESKKRKPITVSTFSLLFARQLEKAVAPHSSTLAWKIPWTEEPGGLPSLGSHRVGHDWRDLAAAAGGGCHDLKFLYHSVLSQSFFHSPPSPSSRGSLVPLRFLWYHLYTWRCWGFSRLSWFQPVTHPAPHFSWCAQCMD